MKLVDDWKRVLRQAWSVWLSAFLALAGVLQAVVPALDGVVSPTVFAWLTAAAAIGAIVARLVHQPAMHEQDASDSATATGWMTGDIRRKDLSS